MIIAIVAVVAIILLVALLLSFRRIAEPNEALIISGVRKDQGPEGTEEAMTFKIVTGRGVLVIPGLQMVRKLSLDLRNAQLDVTCVTTQGIPVHVEGVVAFKVADDLASIANAAVRFLNQQNTMEARVHNIFAGHLRSIIGGMTVEELIRDRERLNGETRVASGDEMAKLGLAIDSLQIHEIDDPTGYIENLAKPHIAQVQKDARIAQAENGREASKREAEMGAEVAEAQRASAVKQAGYTAEVQEAQAKAAQAGPLAQATAEQAVVEQQTRIAELAALRRERELDAEIRKPADAENYAQVKRAEADQQARILAAQAQAETTRQVGIAEGDATKAKGEAEGAALKARADGLRENQEAVIGQQLASQAADIIRAAAGAFDNIENFTVLNGADGVGQAMNSILSQAMTGLGTVREALGKQNGNGHMDHLDLTHEEDVRVGVK